jgi:hypothetical protein
MSGVVMSLAAFQLPEPASYTPHALHAEDRAWVETNCYVDVWIELLHALKLNPVACMGMAVANDFDGDQWTFYKPPHEDLFELYGLDVHELNVWKSILGNASEQLQRGRVVLTEIDSFYLPDTAGTDYRRNHVKTTIAIQHLNLDTQELRYFHNRSYHQLMGEDFVKLFRVGVGHDPLFMPFFAEFVRLDRIQARDDASLALISRAMLKKHFARRPAHNPVLAYRPRFLDDIESLKAEGIDAYHAYAFANLRQLGSGAELLASQLKWLQSCGQGDFSVSAESFTSLSNGTKTLLMKAARAVVVKKPADLGALIDELAAHWQSAMQQLGQELA